MCSFPQPEHQEDIAALAAWVTRAMRRAAAEKTDAREPPRPPPPVPCLYTTPQRTQVLLYCAIVLLDLKKIN